MRCPLCLDPTDEYIDIIEEDSGVGGLDTTIRKIEDEGGPSLYIVRYGSLSVSVMSPEEISDFDDVLSTLSLQSSQAGTDEERDQCQSRFERIVAECPVNIPSEYSDESLKYLKSFLSVDRLRDLQRVSEELDVEEEQVLSVALVEKNRSESLRYTRTIRYYVEERNRIRQKDYQRDELHLASDLFSLLLLFTALCEDLVAEILTSELLREEAKLQSVVEQEIVGEGSRYKSHLNRLHAMDIIDPAVYEILDSLREQRNDATHDVLRRKEFDAANDGKADLIGMMEESLQCLLVLSGRKAPHIICNYGPSKYRSEKQEDAVKIAKEHWVEAHPEILESLEECEEIEDLSQIRWDPRRFDPSGYEQTGEKDGTGSYRITEGVNDIENLGSDVYSNLMDFAGAACGATRTVVNRDLHEANLSRQDFMLFSLLVSDSDRVGTLTQVANRIFSTEQYVRRKHISLDWRTPESDKQILCLSDPDSDQILGLPD